MAGVVDPRGHLVGHQATADFEEFDSQDADVVERRLNPVSIALSIPLETLGDIQCWSDGPAQYAVGTWVFSTSG